MKLLKSKLSLLILVYFLLVLFTYPLRFPEWFIESYILWLTPIGTGYQEVLNEISEKDWKLDYKSKQAGFYHQEMTPEKVIGEQSIRARMGIYRGIPLQVSVSVFWGFDEKGKLIDIWVWKTANGI